MSAITGSWPLTRTELRLDGRLLAPWTVLTTFLSASSVLVYPWLFPSTADRAGFAAVIGGNPAVGLVFGPARDLMSDDGFNVWRSLSLGGLFAGIGVIFAMVRATRAQEDSGQGELFASGVMGRGARLMSAVWLCLSASVILGAVTGLVTVACGGTWNASMLLAATMSATGCMATGIAAVTAQLGSDARTANSLAVGTLGTLFVLRGFAYSVDAPDWTIWANPLGWMSQTRPAADNSWWPLLLAVGLTVLLLVAAFGLQARRDFGVGAIAGRPGPARGGARSARGLAWRLNRGPVMIWTVAFIGLGLVFGNLASSVPDILSDESMVQQTLAAGATSRSALIGSFMVTMLSLIGIIACIPGVQTMLKVRTEETEDRVEPLIATAISRRRYYGANVALAFAASTVYVLVAGVLVAAAAAHADIGVSFSDTFMQAVATVPAVWTVIGLSTAVIGVLPRVSVAAWAGVMASFVITLLGPTFKFWDWVMAISPFWHIPNVAEAGLDWSGLAWISLVTLVLLTVGFAGFRRRDLAR